MFINGTKIHSTKIHSRLAAVALATLVSFGGLSALAAPAHADGLFVSVIPRVLFGNSDGDGYARAYRGEDHWRRPRSRERFRGYHRHEGDRRQWRENRDRGYARGDNRGD